jgi:hypothetical protein
LIRLVWLPLALTCCGGADKDKYAQAALGTGITVAAVGVNRAVTGDCWAQCSPGYLCNEKSGLCERGECYPDCEVGSHCVRDARDVTFCAPDATRAPPPKAQSNPPPQQQAPQHYPESIPIPTER